MKFKVENNIAEAKKAIEKGIAKSLEELGEKLANEAKKRAPVDTGELRDSIDYEVKGDELFIGAKAEHAPFVEYGTSKMKRQPFLKKSVMDNVNKIEKTIAKNMPKE